MEAAGYYQQFERNLEIILSGLEAGLQTVLVLSGISGRDTADQFPYRPTRVIESVKELVGITRDPFQEDTTDLWREVLLRQRSSVSFATTWTADPERN